MIKTFIILSVSIFVSFSAFAKIVFSNEKLFIEKQGSRVPLALVNEMIENKSISRIKLFDEGKVRLLSFAKEGQGEKLYSVDDKGYLYSIEPFTSYDVSKIHQDGRIEFKQVPGRKYRVDSKGFFLY